ncbi:MAG: hypothetical protein KY476_25605 [Planctomycetes bacterium]|nr:hypothetical protein [Planctomycetota bacterium]
MALAMGYAPSPLPGLKTDEMASSTSTCAGLTSAAGRILLVWMAAATLAAGCDSAGAPELAVREVTHHAMPPAGRMIPAPRSIATAAGDVWYVLDNAGRVLVFEEGRFVRHWEMPESTDGNPEGVLVLADGRIAVADTHYHRVVLFDTEGQVVSMFGSYGREPGQFNYPVSIAQDDEGHLYVAEYGANDRVQKFTVEGEFLLEFGGFGTAAGEFQRAGGIAWHDGRVYIADAANNRIQIFSDDGRFERILYAADREPPLEYPYDLAVHPGGDVFVVEYGGGRVSRLSPAGERLGRYGGQGRGERQLLKPWGLALTSDGRRVLVADTDNRRVVELRLE